MAENYNMIKFNKKQLTHNKIDQFIQLGVNVLLIGKHGVGKTTKILEGFDRNKLNYAYFSASTLDPWVHLIGVPKAKTGKNGRDYLDFILPENLDENLDAIFVDEYNRAPTVVKNALMELLQFKQINGRKFPNLKFIWAAINPPKEEEQDNSDYDVDEMDLAQLDRFQVILELPYTPDKRYFISKYGDIKGKALVDWWGKQSEEAKKILSPRRLDYIGDYFINGGDVTDLLPASANSSALIKNLSVNEDDLIFDQVFNNPSPAIVKKFFSDDKNYMKFIHKFDDPKYYVYFYLLKSEFVNQKIREDQEFQYFAIAKALDGDTFYDEKLKELDKTRDKEFKFEKVIEIIKLTNKDDISKLVQLEDVTNTSNGVLSPLYKSNPAYPEYLPSDWQLMNTSYKNINPAGNIGVRLKTQDYRRILPSIKNHMVEDFYMLANVVLRGYNSMQEGTLNKMPEFKGLFNSTIMRIKSEGTPKDIKAAISYISQTTDKLKLKQPAIDYLQDKVVSSDKIEGCLVNSRLKEEIEKAIKIVNYV